MGIVPGRAPGGRRAALRLFAAAELKIDANAMEGFMPSQYDEILGLKAMGLHTVVIAALGYRHPEDFYQHLIKVRRPQEELFINFN